MKKFIEKILFVTAMLVPFASLSAVEIVNNISTSASTGGNSAGGGSVVEGESRAEVKIYTKVDGEVLTDIEETKIAPKGEDAVIKQKVEVNVSDVLTSVEEKVETEPENKRGVVIAFLGKIFKYVLSIF